jgi:hypothetical protein
MSNPFTSPNDYSVFIHELPQRYASIKHSSFKVRHATIEPIQVDTLSSFTKNVSDCSSIFSYFSQKFSKPRYYLCHTAPNSAPQRLDHSSAHGPRFLKSGRGANLRVHFGQLSIQAYSLSKFPQGCQMGSGWVKTHTHRVQREMSRASGLPILNERGPGGGVAIAIGQAGFNPKFGAVSSSLVQRAMDLL